MKEECLICKAPLEYLQEDVEMECAICHKKNTVKLAASMVTMSAINAI